MVESTSVPSAVTEGGADHIGVQIYIADHSSAREVGHRSVLAGNRSLSVIVQKWLAESIYNMALDRVSAILWLTQVPAND